MHYINNRLIVNEDELQMDCVHLECMVRGWLRQNGFSNSEVHVELDDEACDETGLMYWMEIGVYIEHPKGINTMFTFATDNYQPQLVYKDGKFQFYYIFELVTYTGTGIEKPILEYIHKVEDNTSYTITLTR